MSLSTHCLSLSLSLSLPLIASFSYCWSLSSSLFFSFFFLSFIVSLVHPAESLSNNIQSSHASSSTLHSTNLPPVSFIFLLSQLLTHICLLAFLHDTSYLDQRMPVYLSNPSRIFIWLSFLFTLHLGMGRLFVLSFSRRIESNFVLPWLWNHCVDAIDRFLESYRDRIDINSFC